MTYVSELLNYYNSEEKLMKDLENDFKKYQIYYVIIHL